MSRSSTLFRFGLLPFIIMVSLACASCTSYKMEIQQGNVIEEERLARIKPGMTEAQVRYILGSPLLKDDFHKDRWDYIFYLKQPGVKEVERKSVTIFFKKGRVSSLKK